MRITFDESGKPRAEGEEISPAVQSATPEGTKKKITARAKASSVAEPESVSPEMIIQTPPGPNTSERKKTFLHVAEVVAGLLIIGGAVAYFLLREKPAGTVVFEAPKEKAAPAITPPKPEDIVIVKDTDGVQGSAKENIATADPKIFSAPTNFKSFQYSAKEGKTLALSGTCRDAYYTVLVFDSSVDYRTNPAASRVNTAYECPPNGRFSLDVSLQQFNLRDGSYYVFIADQGNTGSWYNPR